MPLLRTLKAPSTFRIKSKFPSLTFELFLGHLADVGGGELDKHCSVMNLQKFGQWAFPAGHLGDVLSAEKGLLPLLSWLILTHSSMLRSHAPSPGKPFLIPLQSKSLSSGFSGPSSLIPQQCHWILCLSPHLPLLESRSNLPVCSQCPTQDQAQVKECQVTN